MREDSRRLLLFAGITSTLIHAGYVMLAPAGYLESHSIVDDTYYYWVIARRFWEAGFFTFDGINPTNGFQPLWQFILLPLGLFGKAVQLRLSLLLSVAAYQGAAWLLALWRVHDDALRTSFRIAALALWVNARFLFEYASSGMEFGLYLFVATWAVGEAVLFVQSRDEITAGNWLRLTIALALLPLARVDGIGLSGILGLFLLSKSSRAIRMKLLRVGFASVIPFLLVLLFNHVYYDSALPVSGTVKRLGQMHDLREAGISIGSVSWFTVGIKETARLLAGNVLRFFGGWLPPGPWPMALIVLFGFGALTLILVLHWRKNHKPVQFHWIIAALLLFAIIQAAVYSFVIPQGTHYAQWYFGPVYLGLGLAAGWMLRGYFRQVALIGAVLLPLSLVALVVLPQPVQIPTAGLQPVLNDLKAMDLAPETRIGSWNAGIVAFRAPENVAVVNLDGLVNSREFAENYAVGVDKRPYLVAEEIEYLMDYAGGTRPADWQERFAIRLGIGPMETAKSFKVLSAGPTPPEGAAEPRTYFLLQFDPGNP